MPNFHFFEVSYFDKGYWQWHELTWNCHQEQDTDYFDWGKNCAKLFQQMLEYRNAQNILNFTSIFIELWKYIQVGNRYYTSGWVLAIHTSVLSWGEGTVRRALHAQSSNSGSCLEESGVVSACHLSSREAETGGSPGCVSLPCLVSSRTVTLSQKSQVGGS